MNTMKRNISSAVFDLQREAEGAIRDLRAAGVKDSAISVIARDGGDTVTTDGSGTDTGEATKDVLGKAALGSGVGALLGVAAMAIPGVGPFVAAGAIAEAAAGGAALTGTAVGAAAGGLVGALEDHGVSREDATYYEERLNAGGTFISVDTTDTGVDNGTISDILYKNGGHNAGRARNASVGTTGTTTRTI